MDPVLHLCQSLTDTLCPLAKKQKETTSQPMKGSKPGGKPVSKAKPTQTAVKQAACKLYSHIKP